jgi:ElaB/YqjD/DUF883 family membrane-anchored ribosome-binding protein
MINTQELAQKAEKISYEFGERMGSFASQMTSTTTDTVDNTRDYIKENPTKSVLMAAAVGIAVGGLLALILRRKS